MPQVEILKLKEGSRPVLFAVHGSGGVLSYAKIARHLDRDQPMYVVKGKGLDNPDHPFRDLYDLAGQYVSAMLEIQTSDPFLMCGRFSPILIEVGQQLLSRGIPVPLTMAFDMAPPEHTQEARRSMPMSVLRAGYRWFKRLRACVGTQSTSTTAPPIHGQPVINTSAGMDGVKYIRGLSDARKINDALHANYVLKDYHAKVVYIQCMDFSQTPKKAKHIEKWKAVAEEVDVHVTPGGHSTMYEKPHVQILARIVQAECDKSTAHQPSP